MKSIFTQLEYPSFWEKISSDSPAELLRYPLPYPDVSITLCTNLKKKNSHQKYLIFGSNLVQVSQLSFPKKFTNLNLKRFEPFSEFLNRVQRFGFYLNSKTFFTDSEGDLLKIIKHVKKFCILSFFHEKFIIIKPIGLGSTSTVYLIEKIRTQQKFAAKCIKKSDLKNDDAILSLSNEIMVLKSTKNPNVISLHSIYEDTENIYMVTDYCAHGTLYDYVQKKKFLTEEEIVIIITKLLQVINFLHNEEIVHRDVKLENILISDQNSLEIKLIDFGLAYDSLTSLKTICGTPGYVAPEILRDFEYDYKVDIFSAGVILYTLLYGKQPFKRFKMNKCKKNEKIEKIMLDDSVSQQANNLIILMLESDPKMRPSASELLSHPWLNRRTESFCPSRLTSSSNINVY